MGDGKDFLLIGLQEALAKVMKWPCEFVIDIHFFAHQEEHNSDDGVGYYQIEIERLWVDDSGTVQLAVIARNMKRELEAEVWFTADGCVGGSDYIYELVEGVPKPLMAFNSEKNEQNNTHKAH